MLYVIYIYISHCSPWFSHQIPLLSHCIPFFSNHIIPVVPGPRRGRSFETMKLLWEINGL
jgi:hypothetical protein